MKQRSFFAQLVGTTIKHYCLEELVQQQQHVAIFLAKRTRGGASPTPTEQTCRLCLLTLPEEITAQERLILLGQVQQEVSRIAALRHPVIQPILEYGHEQGMTYLATPYIPERYALANVLSTEGALDVIRAGYHLKKLASALEYAHKHAINHGNLTASSVFLLPSSEGRQIPSLQLTDIGIAHLQTLLKPSNDVSAGTGLGLYDTVPILEQPINSMSDVSALGALLYQMLTAHDAIAAGWAGPGMRSQLPPLNTWHLNLPTQLDAVINTALGGGQAQRAESVQGTGQGLALFAPTVPTRSYQSPKALVDAYYQVVMPAQKTVEAGPVVVERGLAPHRPLQAPAQSQRLTRRKLTVAMAATGAGVVVVGGGWLFLQSQQGSQVPQGSTPVLQATTPPQNHAPPRATPPQQPTGSGKVIAHTADLPVNQAHTFTIPNSTNPGVLIHLPDKRFVAFDTTCTHMGCKVSYSTKTGELECPCHDAIFDPANNAAVVAGPAPTPLVPINIHVNADGTIVVVG